MANHPKQQPRRQSGGLRAFVLTAIAALAVGAGTGAVGATGSDPQLAGIFQRLGLGPSPVDGASEQLPPPPGDFPDASQRNLPEVTASAIETLATNNDYECDMPTEDADREASPRGAEHWLDCDAPSSHGALVAKVEVEYDDDAQVVAVSARCERGGRTQETYCPSVFVATAQTVFAGQPDVQEEAATWAEENVDNDATTVIGGIQLKANLGQHRLTFVAES